MRPWAKRHYFSGRELTLLSVRVWFSQWLLRSGWSLVQIPMHLGIKLQEIQSEKHSPDCTGKKSSTTMNEFPVHRHLYCTSSDRRSYSHCVIVFSKKKRLQHSFASLCTQTRIRINVHVACLIWALSYTKNPMFCKCAYVYQTGPERMGGLYESHGME